MRMRHIRRAISPQVLDGVLLDLVWYDVNGIPVTWNIRIIDVASFDLIGTDGWPPDGL